MKPFVSERRLNRSEEIHAALALQLAASAKRARFSAMVLADDLGLVFATVGDRRICERMAAISPILSHGMKTWHGTVKTGKGHMRLSVSPIKIDHGVFYLSAAEGETAQLTKELFTSGRGICRILN